MTRRADQWQRPRNPTADQLTELLVASLNAPRGSAESDMAITRYRKAFEMARLGVTLEHIRRTAMDALRCLWTTRRTRRTGR